MENNAYDIGWDERNIGKRYYRLAPCGKHWLSCSCGSARVFDEENEEIGHSCATSTLVRRYFTMGKPLNTLVLLECKNKACYGTDENITIQGNGIIFKHDPRQKKYRVYRNKIILIVGRNFKKFLLS